jgi:hypothetical protein
MRTVDALIAAAHSSMEGRVIETEMALSTSI